MSNISVVSHNPYWKFFHEFFGIRMWIYTIYDKRWVKIPSHPIIFECIFFVLCIVNYTHMSQCTSIRWLACFASNYEHKNRIHTDPHLACEIHTKTHIHMLGNVQQELRMNKKTEWTKTVTAKPIQISVKRHTVSEAS